MSLPDVVSGLLLSGRSEVRVLSGVPKQINSRKFGTFRLFLYVAVKMRVLLPTVGKNKSRYEGGTYTVQTSSLPGFTDDGNWVSDAP